jgi:hypothetical protein
MIIANLPSRQYNARTGATQVARARLGRVAADGERFR